LDYHRWRRRAHVLLIVDGCVFELHPHRRTHVMIQVNAGHSVDCSIEYLDQNGNPMLTAPTPDSPPAWTNAPSAPGIDTLTVSPDGSTAVLATNAADAAGSDTLSLTVVVGGKSFAATLAVAISAAPQVLTSVQIAGTVV
jgi:hypothetical protein